MPLEIIEHKDRLQIELPPVTCLLSDQGFETVGKLINIAEKIGTPGFSKRYICLLLKGIATDRNIKWYGDLHDRLLLNETFSRIMTFRWLLSLIRKSSVPWIFVAGDDCLGTTWELALACSRRYWFSEEAHVGFPEVSVGGFPSGGSVEAFARVNPKFKDFWGKTPVVSSREAFAQDYISFCSPIGADWCHEFTKLLTEEGFYESAPLLSIGEHRKFSRTDLSETFGADTKEIVAEQLDAMRTRIATSGAPYGEIWEYCWGLIKERSKLKDSRELGRLVGILSARFYHSRRYQSFLYANCVKFEAEKLPKHSGVSLGRLVIDLNFLAPPTAILSEILQAGVRIIFIASEARALMASLNMLYNRLERSMGANSVRHLWHHQVAWYTGHCGRGQTPTLRWTADDRVMIETEGGTFDFLSLDGNSSQSQRGIMETVKIPSETIKSAPVISSIVSLIATGLYESPFKSSRLPLSIFVRSSFFQELMRIAPNCSNDVQNVVQNLKQQGWQFAGDEEAWDRFLSSRLDIYGFDRSYQNLGFAGLSQSEWEIGSFKHARSVVKRHSEKSDAKWSATKVSQHLAGYLGILVLHVSQSMTLKEIDAVDHIAAVALGFPAAMGTPVAYIRNRGFRKMTYYASSNWPGVNAERTLKLIRHSNDVL